MGEKWGKTFRQPILPQNIKNPAPKSIKFALP